jgi:hypothetical protein
MRHALRARLTGKRLIRGIFPARNRGWMKGSSYRHIRP